MGAGPSGLAAAINLAKAGYKVSVFERRQDCGWRFGGDLQGLENWSYKEDVITSLSRMNVAINFDCKPFSTLMVTNGSKTFDLHFTKPLVYLLKRGIAEGSLDQGLKRQALDAGVKIYFNKTIPHAQAHIVATGPNVRELMPGVDIGVIFKTTMSDTAVALVHNKAAYRGYAYLLVTNGYGCMCAVALVSGYLAAQSIIHNTDYEAVAKEHFIKRMKASVVNRFLWEVFNDESYTFFFKVFGKLKDPQRFLYESYNYTFIQKMLYPLARIYGKF